MAPSTRKCQLVIVFLGILVAGAQPGYIVAQNCGCAADECCSRWGFCGTGNDYCNTGCHEGPCFAPAPTNDVSVPDIVTPEFLVGSLIKLIQVVSGRASIHEMYFLRLSVHILDLVGLVQLMIPGGRSQLSLPTSLMRLDVRFLSLSVV